MSYKFFTTIDPQLYNLNVYYEKDLYEKATNFSSILSQGLDTLDLFLEYSKSLVKNDPYKIQSQLFEYLDQEGISLYEQIQYKIFWFEKYITSANPVKVKFNLSLKDKIKVFKEISDDIGLLRNVQVLPDDSLLSIYDVDFNLVTDEIADQLVPYNFASTLDNKIKPDSKILNQYMSRFNTSLFRHNMYQLSEPYSDSKEPHGSNLVTDYYHYDRIYNIAKEELESELTKFYGSLYDIILFYENYNPQDYEDDNLQLKQKGAILFTLEGLEKKTDYLKKEVGFYKNIATSAEILGVRQG